MPLSETALDISPFQRMLDRSASARYAFAALCIVAMVLVRLSLDPLIGRVQYPLVLMFPAVLVAAWAGGRGPGLFAVALAVVAVQWAIAEPRGGFKPMTPDRALGVGIFLVAAAVCVLLATAQRNAQATIRDIGQARRRSERQTRALLASLPNGAGFVVDDGLVVRIAEGELAEVFGSAPPKLVDCPAPEALAGIGPDEAWFRQALAGSRVEREMAVGDRVVAWRALPLQDDDDRVHAILVTAADVTERRRAREEQRASERKLRTLANAMPQLVWMADAGGTVTYYNRRVDQYAGLKRAGDGSWAWNAVVHPDDAEATVAAWNAARSAGDAYAFEHRLRMADGSWRWHLSRGLRGPEAQGDGTTWYGTATDIHDLKRTEEQLRRSDERYRAFVGNSSEGIWCLEFDPPIETSQDTERQIDLVYEHGRFVECNDAIAAMYALPSAADLIGQSLARFLPPAEPGSRAYLAAIIGNGYAIRDAESQEVGADGAPRWFLNGVSSVVEDGHLVRSWGTQRDITELRRAEA